MNNFFLAQNVYVVGFIVFSYCPVATEALDDSSITISPNTVLGRGAGEHSSVQFGYCPLFLVFVLQGLRKGFHSIRKSVKGLTLWLLRITHILRDVLSFILVDL